jgi:WD40 repeat protein
VLPLRWDKDGKTLITGSTAEFCVWDVEKGQVERTIPFGNGDLSPDNRLIASGGDSFIRLVRMDDGQLLHTLVSLSDGQYAVVSPEGHYRGSPGVEKELVYVVQTDEGQETLNPDEFSTKYGWKNDPDRAREATDRNRRE